MDMKTTRMLAESLPANQSILLIGQHGVGKSQLVRQIAKHFHEQLSKNGDLDGELPVCDETRGGSPKVNAYLIDMRLSQMSEGDMIGLPELVNGVTQFDPPAWFMQACLEPRIIFLDEINRATPEVMQAAFQVVLDYQLNGHRLHPKTRVYAAINPDQGAYSVNSMDPALIDRFAVVELEPSAADWHAWAKDPEQGNILPQIRDFLSHNADFLDPPKNAQPGRPYQSRRSWEMLDRAIRHNGLEDCIGDDAKGQKGELLFALALSRHGVEAAQAFVDYVRNIERQITADDVLNTRWTKKFEKRIEGLGAERFNVIVEKLGEHAKDNKWTDTQGKNLGRLCELMPGEHVVQLWNAVAGSANMDNVKTLHKHAVKIVLEHLNNKADEEASDQSDK